MWLFGLIQRKNTSVCCGIMNSWDTITLTITTLYFMFWSKNWFALCFAMSLLGLIGHTIMMFIPDCPVWLLQHGRKKDAIKALNRIAKINGSKVTVPFDTVFVEEQTSPQQNLNNSAISELT